MVPHVHSQVWWTLFGCGEQMWAVSQLCLGVHLFVRLSKNALITLQLLNHSQATKDLGDHVQRTLTGMGVGGTIRPTHYRLFGDPHSVKVCA